MGLIKAAKNAIGSTLHDQWKEAIRCEDLGNEILMKKITTPQGVISNKSTIIVAPGQCAIVYDNGRVIDATAEEGVYVFDTSSTPSFFAGQFGKTFKEMWERFTYDGASAKEQAVFFFNIKEIIDNKFGTASPIPFQDWSHPIPNQMTNTIVPLRVQIKCYGKYTFRIINPALFMQNVAGVAEEYRKEKLVEQCRTEVMAVFQNIVNELGTEKHKVPVLEMPSQTDEIKEIMDQEIFDEPMRKRGIQIDGFAVESVTLDEESKQKIDDYELSSNSYMQQGRMVGAYSEAIKSAAQNTSGSMNGFMGLGMVNMATGNTNVGAGAWQNTENSRIDLSNRASTTEQTEFTNKANTEQTAETKVEENIENQTQTGWTCECGNKNNQGMFCPNCGKPKPQERKCPKCGETYEEGAKFCSNCGTKLD